MKQVQWLADVRARVRAFPPGVQDGVGYSLFLVQTGKTSQNVKPLHGFGCGVMESSAGIATPKRELDLVRRRLQLLRGEVTDGKK